MASTPRGIKHPAYTDKIKDGVSPSALVDDITELATSADAAISQAVQEAKEDADTEYGGLSSRVTAVEAKNTAQDSRLTSVEGRNTEQDGRIDGLEDLQPVKSVRLEAGKWVWDPAGSPTHYVLIDHDGKPTVRATPWPAPNQTKPEFTW